jgi:toxin CptA
MAATSLWFSLREALMKSPRALITLVVAEDDTLNLQDQSGNWSNWTVLGSTYVGGFLVVLNLQSTEQRLLRPLTILPDAIDAENFRQLRIWLRWKAIGNPTKLEGPRGV